MLLRYPEERDADFGSREDLGAAEVVTVADFVAGAELLLKDDPALPLA